MRGIELVKQYLTDYATYVNQIRANVALDGFKAVQRRIYYVAYKMAKDKFLKTATIVGNVIAYYHPHGDASVADAIVGMVRNGWLTGKGNWGSKCTIEEIKPAAMRYTEVKFNNDLEWTMKLIKFADYTLSDIDYEEPLLLPTPVPIGLIGDLVDYPQNQQGIGVGIRTVIPMYKLKDLVEIIDAIINNKPVPNKDPFFGTYVEIVKSESDKILTTGEGKTVIRPQYVIDNRELHIYALTRNILNVIKPIKDKISLIDNSTANRTHVIIQPKKYQKLDVDKVFNDIIKKMTVTVSFVTYVSVPDKEAKYKVYKLGIIPWLNAQFKYYVECKKRYLQNKIDNISRQITELKLIKEIRPYLVDYLHFTKNPDPDEFLAKLPDSFDKTIVSELLKKYSIRKLLSVDTDIQPLIKELNDTKAKLETVTHDSLEELKQIVGVES